MKYNFSPNLKTIIGNAEKIAKSLNNININLDHIILGVLMDYENECVSNLIKMNINIEELYKDIYKEVDSTQIKTLFTTSDKPLPFASSVEVVFNNLLEETKKTNSHSIDARHLLLLVLKTKITSTTKILNTKYGINYNNFLNTINGMKEDKFRNAFDGDEIHDEPEPFKRRNKQTDSKSKTPVLDNFCKDISKAVEKGEIDPVIGRKVEIKRISQILSRRKKNNPILIGAPGTGKTSIVEGLAQLIQDGNAPRTLTNKRIFALDLASLVAGTKYRGQFEERMKAVLEECKANPEIVLFIDELHTIVGAGNASGSLDASNIFKPALARGEIQIIGATTLDEYRENIEKDGALTRRFQEILVEEPTLEETKIILMKIKDKYEKHHRVKYTEEAIDECVKLADRYIMDRSMPDKAIDILDEAGAVTNVVTEKPEEIKLLEIKKNEIIEKKKEVVIKQRYEEAATLRDEEKQIIEELKAANDKWDKTLEHTVTEVGVEIVSEIVSMMTGIPLNKISTQETKRLLNMDKELMGKVIGQDIAVSKVVKAIKRSRVGLKDKNKTLGNYIFLGPSGSGKSLLAKLLAEQVFGDADSLIRMDMSEYMERHSVSKLIGAPAGYVGYEQGGQLTEKVRRKPHCVILFDEIEKAHEDVFNVLLQLLDEGHLTDGLGRKVNFKNALVILTSNIGVSELNSFAKNMGFETSATIVSDEKRRHDIIEKALKRKFTPEFLNRIDETIIFRTLSTEDIHKIIYLEIKKLEDKLLEMNFKLKISEEAISFLAKEGYDENYGARPLARTIQHYVEDKITDEILNETIKENDIISIELSPTKDDIIITNK